MAVAFSILAAACASPAGPGGVGTHPSDLKDGAATAEDATRAPAPDLGAGANLGREDAEPTTPPADGGGPADATAGVDGGDTSGQGISDGLTQLLVSSGVGMGYYHACHLMPSMDVRCFGSPLTHPRLRPPAGVKSKQISCAHDGCCVLLPPEAGARLRCWSDKAPFFPPQDVLRAIDPVQVGIGYNHDCVLNADHSVKCWGQ